MVFSTSGTDRSSNSMYFFQRQLVFAVLGVFVCLVFQFWNYTILKRFAILMYVAGIGLILMLISPLGVSVKGATRWLNIGIQFQVAEGLIGFRKKYRSADLFLLDGIHLIEDNQIAIL